MLRCYSDHVAIESQETRENKWNTLPNKTIAAFGLNDLTYTLFISNTFISNARLKLAKNKPNAKKHTEAELLLYENYLHYSSILSSKNNSSYSNSKKQAKEQMCLYSKDYTISHKNVDENEKQSHRDDMNRPKSGHGHKYSKHKKCLSMMMMLICTNQHRRNIRSSIHEKDELNWGWIEKIAA